MNKMWKYLSLNKGLISLSFLVIVLFLSIRVSALSEVSSVTETHELTGSDLPTLSAAEHPFDFEKSPLEASLYILPISEEPCDEQDERESDSNEDENHLGQEFRYSAFRIEQNCIQHSDYPIEVRVNRTSVSLVVLHHSWKSDLA
jgi:hypothetical protein